MISPGEQAGGTSMVPFRMHFPGRPRAQWSGTEPPGQRVDQNLAWAYWFGRSTSGASTRFSLPIMFKNVLARFVRQFGDAGGLPRQFRRGGQDWVSEGSQSALWSRGE
jgi:hypothetical protein